MEAREQRDGEAVACPDTEERRRLLTLPRRDGNQLLVDARRSPSGSPYVEIRVWTPTPEPLGRPIVSLDLIEAVALVSVLAGWSYETGLRRVRMRRARKNGTFGEASS